MTELAYNMPYVFLVFFGLVTCVAPQWRITAFIVFMSAVLNISLAGFYLAVSEMMEPVIPTFTIYALIDLLTGKIIISWRPVALFGHDYGVEGATHQAFILILFAIFNAIAFLDYRFFGSVLKSWYVLVIFGLNLSQIITMGTGIYALHRKPQSGRHLYHWPVSQHSRRVGSRVVHEEGSGKVC